MEAIKTLTEQEIKEYEYLKIKYTVYITTNLINSKIYVGVHRTENPLDDYLGSGRALLSSVKKYGIENFKKEIIAIFDNAEDMLALEKEIVNRNFLKRSDVYNIAMGGNGDPEYKGGSSGKVYIKNVKLKKNKFVFKDSEECKKLLAEGWEFGRYMTEEHLQKLLEISIGNKVWEGRHHTEETKAKQRAKHLGVPKTEEAKQKMRLAWEKWRRNDTSKMGHPPMTPEEKKFLSDLYIGCTWIKNEELDKQKLLRPESDEFKELLKQGWVIGRLEPKNYNKIWIRNIFIRDDKYIDKNSDECKELLNNGYEYGNLNEFRIIGKENNLNWVWIKNDKLKLSTRIYEGTDEYKRLIESGEWERGRANYIPKNKLTNKGI